MSPGDVGGEGILNNLRGDVATALKGALLSSMNQQCYCREPLRRTTWKRPYSDWICRSCFTNQSGRVVFDCPNDNCIFKRLSGSDYEICTQCFERRDNDQICDETDEKENGTEDTFICKQIKGHINMISSDSLYYDVWLTVFFESMKLHPKLYMFDVLQMIVVFHTSKIEKSKRTSYEWLSQ